METKLAMQFPKSLGFEMHSWVANTPPTLRYATTNAITIVINASKRIKTVAEIAVELAINLPIIRVCVTETKSNRELKRRAINAIAKRIRTDAPNESQVEVKSSIRIRKNSGVNILVMNAERQKLTLGNLEKRFFTW